MRIIKPYGRSVVKKTDHDKPTFARKIEIPNPKTNTEKAPGKVKARDTTGGQTQRVVDVGSPEHENLTFFIAQWSSMLDKILFKPENKKKAIAKFKNSPTLQARKKASAAIQLLWLNKNLTSHFNEKELIKLWEKKVDPYDDVNMNNPSSNSADKHIITRRWFNVFCEGQSAEACNWTQIAENLYQHLYIKRKTLAGKTKKLGLIESRADSIRKNASKIKVKMQELSCDSHRQSDYLNDLKTSSEPFNWTKVRQDYQLETLIETLNNTLNKPPKNLQYYQIPLDCLYKHYGVIFGKDTTIEQATQSSPQLLAYHFAIKDALKRNYPKIVHPNRKNSKQKRPLLTADSLHQRVIFHEDNQRLALAIRLGKVIHYEMEQDGPYRDDDSIVLPNAQAIANSSFWESKGQTLIKQNESFVRQWLGAIAIANSTLERLANPDLKINDDITYQDTIDNALELVNPKQFEHQFTLLFGDEHRLYETNDRAQRDKFTISLKQKRNRSLNYRIDALLLTWSGRFIFLPS